MWNSLYEILSVFSPDCCLYQSFKCAFLTGSVYQHFPHLDAFHQFGHLFNFCGDASIEFGKLC